MPPLTVVGPEKVFAPMRVKVFEPNFVSPIFPAIELPEVKLAEVVSKPKVEPGEKPDPLAASRFVTSVAAHPVPPTASVRVALFATVSMEGLR